MKKIGKKKPSIITEGIRIRSFWYVNIEVSQTQDGGWTWESIPLDPGDVEKAQIVKRIIDFKYPEGEATRIIMSYMSEPGDLEVRWEYEALQAWKSEASKIADEVLAAIEAQTPPAEEPQN